MGLAIELLHAELEEKTIRICQGVDKNLLKFYNGTTPWSPELQQHRDRIKYLYRILRMKTNILTSQTIIKRLSIKLGEYSGQYLTAAEAIVQLKKVWKDYKTAKKTAHIMRTGFQESHVKRLAKDRKISQPAMKSMMEQETKIKEQGRVARAIRGRGIKGPVIKAIAKCPVTGDPIIVDTQDTRVYCRCSY